MIRQRFGTALLALALLAPLSLAAQMPDIPLGKWWKRPRVVEALHLTAEQQDRLEEIFSKNRRQFIDLRADVERRSVDVEEVMARKDSDPKKAAAAIEALEQAKARLGKARIMMVVEMKGILTAEQWQQILERREEWRAERLLDRRGARGPGRDTPPPGRPAPQPRGE